MSNDTYAIVSTPNNPSDFVQALAEQVSAELLANEVVSPGVYSGDVSDYLTAGGFNVSITDQHISIIPATGTPGTLTRYTIKEGDPGFTIRRAVRQAQKIVALNAPDYTYMQGEN